MTEQSAEEQAREIALSPSAEAVEQACRALYVAQDPKKKLARLSSWQRDRLMSVARAIDGASGRSLRMDEALYLERKAQSKVKLALEEAAVEAECWGADRVSPVQRDAATTIAALIRALIQEAGR